MLALLFLGVSAFGYAVILLMRKMYSTDQARESRAVRKANGVPEWLERFYERLTFGVLWVSTLGSLAIAIVIAVRAIF